MKLITLRQESEPGLGMTPCVYGYYQTFGDVGDKTFLMVLSSSGRSPGMSTQESGYEPVISENRPPS